MVTIRKYNPREDEQSWVRCRVLSLLDTPCYDQVLRHKQSYQNPSIELVAVSQGTVIGILDLELDGDKKVICYRTGTKGAIIRNLMVLPEFRQKGVAAHLMEYAFSLGPGGRRDKKLAFEKPVYENLLLPSLLRRGRGVQGAGKPPHLRLLCQRGVRRIHRTLP